MGSGWERVCIFRHSVSQNAPVGDRSSRLAVCLALGIGANTAIFSLFNAVILGRLSVRDPEELIFFHSVPGKAPLSLVRDTSSGYGNASLPYPTYAAFRDNAGTLAGVFVFVRPGLGSDGLTVSVGGRALTADGEMVTGKYFSVLGVSPMLGRAIVGTPQRHPLIPERRILPR